MEFWKSMSEVKQRMLPYCELDVITLSQVFLKPWNKGLIGEDHIIHI